MPVDDLTMTASSTAASESYVAARRRWHLLSAAASGAQIADQVAAAREYVRAIDDYVAGLRRAGLPIPYHLDQLAATLRANYGDAPVQQRA
jgi:hypothetical protein